MDNLLNGLDALPFQDSDGKFACDRHQTAEFVLLTGATGFLGQYLLRDLLQSGVPVAVLIRPNKRQSAEERLDGIMQRFERQSPIVLHRPKLLVGDVSQSKLGLSARDCDWVKSNCRAMMHNAAVVKFEAAGPHEEPWPTNLGGTRNVIDFCRQYRIDDLHYVSSAYTCGDRNQRISENDLDCGQKFRNDYEASKFQAEMAIRAADGFAHKTVYRPSIITADSKTGFTCSYHGMMWYLRLFSILIPQQPRNELGQYQTNIDLPIDGDEPHNVVCVDWVSSTITKLFQNRRSRDHVFHVTSETPTTIRQVVDACCEYFNSTGVRFLGSSSQRVSSSEFSKAVFEAARVYHAYESARLEFDRTNLDRFLPGQPAPVIDAEMVVRFLEFGNRDRWGKSQSAKARSKSTTTELIDAAV